MLRELILQSRYVSIEDHPFRGVNSRSQETKEYTPARRMIGFLCGSSEFLSMIQLPLLTIFLKIQPLSKPDKECPLAKLLS